MSIFAKPGDPWGGQLQQASFRGIPFGVLNAEGEYGRKIALHEYPYRDMPWAEDLGRATRHKTITGFIVENDLVTGTTDVLVVVQAMIAAAEMPGPATLIHPTLGELSIALPPGGLKVRESFDAGRYFELTFTFVEAGETLFPTILLGQLLTPLFAIATKLAIARSFIQSILNIAKYGAAIDDEIKFTTGVMLDGILSKGNDATSLSNQLSTLPGDNGRYVSGANVGLSSTATIETLSAQGAAARSQMVAQSAAVTAAVADPTTYAANAQVLIETLRASIASAATQITLLTSLATLTPNPIVDSSTIGVQRVIAQQTVVMIFQQFVLVEIALAAAAYQPTSYDDAVSVRDTVTGLLEAQILIQADAGNDDVMQAFSDLRKAVVDDLTASGGSLSVMEQFQFQESLPSLYLANRIYADVNRETELVVQADPIHPAFMPRAFRALAN